MGLIDSLIHTLRLLSFKNTTNPILGLWGMVWPACGCHQSDMAAQPSLYGSQQGQLCCYVRQAGRKRSWHCQHTFDALCKKDWQSLVSS